MILDIAIYTFVSVELANVIILYLRPGFRHGNSMAVFSAWGRAQNDGKQRLFMAYLARWVANCKVIFIALLLVIALFGTETLKLWAVLATIASISLYYVTLHPLMRKLDDQGEILPVGYSRLLALNIAGFLLMYAGAAAVHLWGIL